MEVWQAILLGLIQGLAEFLPVSSSGHLVLMRLLLAINETPMAFDIMLHGGSLLAVLIFFRRAIREITFKQLKLILFASIPAGIFGIWLEPIFEQFYLSANILIIGWIITGTLLLISQKTKAEKEYKSMTYKQAGIIGIFQAIAIFPSISRSGSTMVGAIIQGVPRKEAFTFSFLLSIPAVAGAILLSLKDFKSIEAEGSIILLGSTIAFISGIVALKILEKVVIGAKLKYFAYYCYLLAVLVFLLKYPLNII